MPTYIYETIPAKKGAKPQRFEIQQRMNDAPLTQHPETGERIKRVISSGYGLITHHAAPPRPPCSGQCSCYGAN